MATSRPAPGPPAAAMVATAVFEDVHSAVIGAVVPLAYTALAVKAWVPPTSMADGVAGAIWMDEMVGAVTVSAAVPEIPLRAALMVTVPATKVVATPLLPAALDSWATLMLLDVHVACVVRSNVVLLS